MYNKYFLLFMVDVFLVALVLLKECIMYFLGVFLFKKGQGRCVSKNNKKWKKSTQDPAAMGHIW